MAYSPERTIPDELKGTAVPSAVAITGSVSPRAAISRWNGMLERGMEGSKDGIDLPSMFWVGAARVRATKRRMVASIDFMVAFYEGKLRFPNMGFGIEICS